MSLVDKILNGIKNVYLKLFNFMVGNQKRKFYRFFVHFHTVLYFLMIMMFIKNVIECFTHDSVEFSVGLFVALIIWPFFIKVWASIAK